LQKDICLRPCLLSKMPLNDGQLVRYSRNIKLAEIGKAGQEKLLCSKVLVIGAGGLGSPLLLYLAAAGVGTIGIIDSDKVDLSNLQRQILHETSDIGIDKVESAKEALHDLNPEINIKTYCSRLDAGNIEEIIAGYDIIADGSDNFETRFLVNDTCYNLEKPLVSAAIAGFQGQLSTFKAYIDGNHHCYRCIYPDMPPAEVMPSCAEYGVLGAVAGVMGTWQAIEVIKELLGIGETLSGNLIVFNALDGTRANLRHIIFR